MILFLKKWLALVNETGTTSITNYALIWLVIFYLQTKEILPAIHDLFDKNNPKEIAGNKL